MMFSFGPKSLSHLEHVHPILVDCAKVAIGCSTQDFSVDQGCRSLSEEKQHVASGTSRTLKSYHLIQADGFGHAVDLVPFVDGKEVWDWARIYPIVRAMRFAADLANVSGKIRWGGVWDLRLGNIDVSTDSAIAAAVKAYTIRHVGSDLLDGVHFEYRP